MIHFGLKYCSLLGSICGEQYCRLLPNATLRVLERCGHMPPVEQPDRFAELVLDFLRGGPA